MKQNKFIECEIRGCITYGDFIEIKPLKIKTIVNCLAGRHLL